MKVLVIGGGGREHALVWKLKQSPKVTQIFAAPGNAGIAQLADCVDIKATDLNGLVAFAKKNDIDLTVVGPDDPLTMGAVDLFEKAGLKVFGPNKAAAVIEGSKVFSKNLMEKYDIPTAKYEVFDNSVEAKAYVETCAVPVVIKAEGLALGKGVIIAQSTAEAVVAIDEIMEDKVFGEAGNRVVIEEFLTGQEVSVLAFTDGKTVVPMVSAQDHKRALDHDEGLNTGGMGAFSPSRIYTSEIADFCMESIFVPTVEAMRQEGRPFKGVLYFGLMVTKDGVRVIEYNSRFGDPEAQAVLPRLKTDLVDIMLACIDERLDEIEIKWDDRACVCIVMASGGYPQKYETGFEITGLDQCGLVFHAGTKRKDGKFVTAGGRVLGVSALGDDLDDAIKAAYADVAKIDFENCHYRKDIGVK